MASLLSKITRRKPLHFGVAETSLRRCLTTFDLTLLAIGGMVGSGIYVITGVAAKELAGPSIVISFVLAAIVISLVVVCFIEFASRVHQTGTTYLYAYFTLGELCAFQMGWSILLTTLFGAATNARAWSAYLDFLTGNAVARFMRTHVADWSAIGPPLTAQPDLLAAAILFLLTLVVAGGANCSARVNTFCALVNVGVLVFFIVVGFTFADLDNWTGGDEMMLNVTAPSSPPLSPERGFLPYGWAGATRGASACFWAFTGFEAIAMSVEEARNPTQSVPLASAVAVVAVTSLYVATATAMTLVAPVALLDVSAPLPSALAVRGLATASKVAAIGPLLGITTTMLASIFGFVRITYAIATDGLLCPLFTHIMQCARVPCAAIAVVGLVATTLAAFLDIRDLLGFGILLCLLQYIVVAIAVIVLRYRPNVPQGGAGSLRHSHAWLNPIAKFAPGRWVHIATMAVTFAMLPLTAALLHLSTASDAWWWILVAAIAMLLVVCFALGCSIHAHEQNPLELTLKVPFVPFTPLLSIFGCILLLVSMATIRNIIGLIVVFSIGLLVYFSYSIRHSKLNTAFVTEQPLDSESIGLLLMSQAGRDEDGEEEEVEESDDSPS